MVFEIHGQYEDLLTRLFRRTDAGHLEIGTAHSLAPIPAIAEMTDWIEFIDYIMEGFVRYLVRAKPCANGMFIEVQLMGTNRDQYIRSSMRNYIQQAGLSSVEVTAEY